MDTLYFQIHKHRQLTFSRELTLCAAPQKINEAFFSYLNRRKRHMKFRTVV